MKAMLIYGFWIFFFYGLILGPLELGLWLENINKSPVTFYFLGLSVGLVIAITPFLIKEQ